MITLSFNMNDSKRLIMNAAIRRRCVFYGEEFLSWEKSDASVVLMVPYITYGMVPPNKEGIGCQDEIKVKVMIS